MNQEDPRKTALYAGLSQLDDHDLQRIIRYPRDRLLLDGGNWAANPTYADIPGHDRHCPLAVALQIPNNSPRSDEAVGELIGELGRNAYGPGFLYNQMRGTPGNFYRENRYNDLLQVIDEVRLHRPPFRNGPLWAIVVSLDFKFNELAGHAYTDDTAHETYTFSRWPNEAAGPITCVFNLYKGNVSLTVRDHYGLDCKMSVPIADPELIDRLAFVVNRKPR